MVERGILFRDRLVRRILDRVNPKTQTRRIVKPQPERVSKHLVDIGKDVGRVIPATIPDGWQWRDLYAADGHGFEQSLAWHCPYGKPGDRLWVREAWRSWTESHHDHHTDDEPCDEHCRQVYVAFRSTPRVGFRPVPDRAAITYLDESTPIERNPNLLGPWKPGIHLRRDWARIWLDVVAVRVERLQDISEEDAIAEGVEEPKVTTRALYPSKHAARVEVRSYRDAFADLWRSVNGPESWSANPWVWVIAFRRVEAAQLARAG